MFVYQRTVWFQDTDAAGVVYFANVLGMCHEAYEASLVAAGIDLRQFFRGEEVAIPIAEAKVNFFAPMHCGDRLQIHLTPNRLSPSEFELTYEIFLARQSDRSVSRAHTRHVCINPATRSRAEFPAEVAQWLAQSMGG